MVDPKDRHDIPAELRQQAAPVVVAIDDDTTFLLATAKALTSAGMVCHTATSGVAGLRLIRDFAPDLVLLDILLIGESGFTICQEIRRTWSPEALPVIMVTGLEDLESIKAAYESGANDFLAKPLHWKHLPFRILHILKASHDLTERKRIEAALRESEERYRSILRASPDNITISDMEGRILMVSPSAMKMYRCENEGELIGHLGLEFIVPADRDRAASDTALMLQARWPGPGEYKGLRTDGSSFDIEINGEIIRSLENEPSGMVFIIRDITDRKQAEGARRKLEERMNQVQKLEALGTLVGGVAHNINNILMVIMGAASLREGHATETKDLETYTLIGKACTQGRDVVKSLMQFAQTSVSNQVPCDVHALIKDLRILLESTNRNRVTIIEALAGESLWVDGDAGSISNALMNLCLNALDSMPNGGTLTLRTSTPEKHWVEVYVEDTGEGMTPEILARVMNPFFTTKEVGKGTGLGLSMTHGVIKAHGGTLEIASLPGQGTTVKIRFPRIPAPAQQETIE